MNTARRILIQSLRHLAGMLGALTRLTVNCAWALLIAVVLAAGSLVWLDSEAGHQWLATQLSRIDGFKLTGIDGSLLRNPVLIGLVYQDNDYHLAADRISLDWQVLPLLHGELLIDKLQAGRLTVTLKPTPPDRPTTPAPSHLTLPLGLHIASASLSELHIRNPDISLQQLKFDFHSDGRHHWISDLKIRRSGAQLSAGLTLDGRAPFAISGQFDLDDPAAPRPFKLGGKLAGTLRQLVLTATGTGAASGGSANLLIDSFAAHTYQMLQSGTLAVRGFDPSRWSADWPRAELDLTLTRQNSSPMEMGSHLILHNRHPGPLNTQQLPFASLESNLLLRGQQLHLNAVRARLPGTGEIQGTGQLEAGKIRLDLTLANFDLAKIWQGQSTTRLAGSVQLSGPWRAPDIRTDLSDSTHAARLKANIGWINPKTERRIAIRHLELQHGASHLAAHGEFGLQSPYPFRLNGNFAAFNPAEFAAIPSGSLNGTLIAQGQLKPGPEMTLDYQLNNSRFNGAALSGAGKVRLDHQHLSESRFWLALGSNRIDLSGSYGLAGDILQASLALPALHELGPQFAGQANGKFTLTGTPTLPVLDGQVTLDQLLLPTGLRIGHGKLDVSLPRDANAPMHLVFEANQIVQGKQQLARLRLNASGTQAQHAIHLNAEGNLSGRNMTLDSAFEGSLLPDWHWRGALTRLDAGIPAPLHLLEPVKISLAPGEASTEDGIFSLQHSRILLGKNHWQPGEIRSSGQLERLALADVLQSSGRDDFDSDLTFNGRWNLQYTDTLNGEVALTRRDGNSIWRLHGIQESLALTEAGLTLTALHNRIDMQAALRSSRYGSVEFSGNTLIDPPNLALAPGSGVTLNSKGELPDLSAFNGLASPDLQLEGNLRFALQRSGPLDSPNISGSVSGNSLQVRDAATGLNLRDGVLRFTLADNRLILEEAFFRGGEGDVRAEGEMTYRDGEAEATARITARKLTLFSRSDLLLILSGGGDVSLKQGVVGISGQIRADQGEIQYRDIDTPRLAADVVIEGQQQTATLRPPRLTLQVDIDLGNDFRFRGFGVDAQLGGLLRLRAQTSRPLAATGKVEVVEGKYRAYGQRLDIERGVLSFQGPIENPVLDILAMRRNLQVESGVLVSGNALNPRVQLYSEPAVPDTEKLAWLLFGHGSEGMQGADATIMLKAAQALLGSTGNGKGVAEEALSKVGIDELGMRAVRETDGSSTRIVTVSTQLGKYFRLSLEKSLNDLRDAVSLAFQVGRNWSLITRLSNEEATLGANYTIYFE